MRNYNKGDTVLTLCKHKTFNSITEVWALANPDANFPKITIMDALDVVQVNAVSMTAVVTGRFVHLYELALTAALGIWRGYIDVENATYPTREHFTFKVGV